MIASAGTVVEKAVLQRHAGGHDHHEDENRARSHSLVRQPSCPPIGAALSDAVNGPGVSMKILNVSPQKSPLRFRLPEMGLWKVK